MSYTLNQHNQDESENTIAIDARTDMQRAANRLSDTWNAMLDSPDKPKCFGALSKGLQSNGHTIAVDYSNNIEGSLIISGKGNVIRYRLGGSKFGKHDIYLNGADTFVTEEGGNMNIRRLNGVPINLSNPDVIEHAAEEPRNRLFSLFTGKKSAAPTIERTYLPDRVAIADYTNSARFIQEALDAAAAAIEPFVRHDDAQQKAA